MPVRTYEIFVANHTEYPLRRTGHNLCHGEWTPGGWEPPEEIPAGKELGWQSESAGLATGTEGWAKYRLATPAVDTRIPGGGGPPLAPVLRDTLYVYWNNPFLAGTTRHSRTRAWADLTVNDVHIPDCDPLESEDHPAGRGSRFTDDRLPAPSEYHVSLKGYNAGGDRNDDIIVLRQVLGALYTFPWSILLLAGSVGIIEHPVLHLTVRRKGSLKQALPLGYQGGVRRLMQVVSVTTVRELLRV